MGAEWEMIAQKLDTSPEVAQALRRGRSNMSRYYAFLAYEAGEFREAARILLASLRGSPGMFLTDSRNWKMAAMSAAGVALPSGWRRSLERLAGVELARGVNSR